MLSQRLRDIELLADFTPNVQHTPIQFQHADIANLLQSTPEGAAAHNQRNTVPDTDNLDGHESPLLIDAVQDHNDSILAAEVAAVPVLQADQFDPYRNFEPVDLDNHPAVNNPLPVVEKVVPKIPAPRPGDNAKPSFRINQLAEQLTLDTKDGAERRPSSASSQRSQKAVDVHGFAPQQAPRPIEYFADEPAESGFYEIKLSNDEQAKLAAQHDSHTELQNAQATQFQPDDPKYRLLAQYTTSEQLTLLRLLKSTDSEVLTRLDGEGNVYVQVSTLRTAHAGARVPSFKGKYEETHYFCIPSQDVPFGSAIQNKESATLAEWRQQRENCAVREQLRIQQQMARPYMATPRTVSWLHAQLFDIFKQLSMHYVAQSNRFDSLLRVFKVTHRAENLEPLTPFSEYVTRIYAFAKIGHIQKAETYLQELSDASAKYYEVSAAARITTLFMGYEHSYPERNSEFPHRQQDLTAQEASQIVQQQETILPIVVYCISKLFKQTKVSRVLTGADKFVVTPAESSAFSRLDLKLPKHFDARTLDFPISRPVLANALIAAFQAYEIQFSAQLVVVELERLPIWLQIGNNFQIELFLLIENLIRVIVACINGFNGFFDDQTRPLPTKVDRLTVEDLLGI